MLQVEYRLKLGQDEFIIKAEVKNEKEFFEKMSFYSNLPRTAPGGANDLKLVFRTTKKGHKYYSLISESEKMEFKLGQNLEANGNGLFPKGWEKAYQADDEDAGAPAPAFGQQAAAPAAQPAFQQQTAPAPQQQAAPAPGFGMPQPTFAQPAQQQAPAPAPVQTQVQTAPAAAPAPANPQVAAVANNVLARFGINKQ